MRKADNGTAGCRARMKTILLALLLCTAALVAAPAASAGCPDGDHPCTPQPFDPLDPPNMPDCFPYSSAKELVVCLLSPLP